MRSKNVISNQLNFLLPTLKEQLNQRHPLYLLADQVLWNYFESEFSVLYSEEGRPAKPIRLMVSLLMLKHIYNLSDEMLVEEQWVMNPYFQYFSGFELFQVIQPCAASDLVHFRKRIGEEGVEKIFKHSIDLHGKDGKEQVVSIDTTVQEKNITFPTDAKLQKKIIIKAINIMHSEGVSYRRSYTRTIKNLMRAMQNGNHPKRAKRARSARRELRTIANRVVREFETKLSPEALLKYTTELSLWKRLLEQTQKSKDKIYSLHEPDVYCISKGKDHKKYEFGCKGSVTVTQKSGIIVGAMTFKTNEYDGHTLEAVLGQSQKLTGVSHKIAVVDRGYQGKSLVGDTQILRPKPPLKSDTEYQKRTKRKKFRRRAAIEPIIGHIKSDHRVGINYLKGQVGDSINFMMGATGFNLRKLLRKLSWALNFIRYYTHITIKRNHIFQNKIQIQKL